MGGAPRRAGDGVPADHHPQHPHLPGARHEQRARHRGGLAQQLSGINCAIFYSTEIFKNAGLDAQDSQSATLGMGSMNVLMTFVSLVLIEKAGRKTLMVIGLSVMFLMTTLLLSALLTFTSVPAMSYVAIVSVILFV